MHADDVPVGRLLTRREALGVLGVSGVALIGGRAWRSSSAAAPVPPAPACVVRPEQTEGPYFVDERLDRSDVRSDPGTGAVKDGVPLALGIAVSRLAGGACAPLAGALVDIWHCDALGVYSDVQDPGFTTVGQRFLRGYQVTDAAGTVRFRTIYPGWYEGRTVHVHFKIRTEPAAARGFAFTSQLYFDDALTTRVHQRAPYASKGHRRDRNEDDRFFRRGGDQLLLSPTAAGEGYAATFAVGLQLP